jgi:hypothetical protein
MKHITRCWWPLAVPAATAIWLFVVLPIYYGGFTLMSWQEILRYAPLFTAASVIVALFAYFTNRQNQKDALLQRAYFDYAKMAVDNPELAFPFKSKIDLEKQTLNGCEVKFEKYEWFVSATLVMSLFVTNMNKGLLASFRYKNKKHWEGLVINQMSYHWQYIEKFRDVKPFIKNWRLVLEKEMDAGVKLGKANPNYKQDQTFSGDEAV